ncbi:unnamed protein product, partial [Closterium sp. NIES-65]
MPVPMLAEGPMEGLGETLRTEPHEGAPILTSRPPAHPPPRAPLPHPHPQVPVVSRGAAKALAFLAEPCSPTPTLLHGQPPSPSPTPDPTVAGGPPGEHAAHLCPHPQGLLRAPRGAARALAFLEEPCSPTPTNTQPPLPAHYPPLHQAPPHPAHGSGGTRVEGPTGEATTEPTQISLPPPLVPRSNLHTGPAPRPPPPTPPPGRVPHEWPRWAAITPHTQPARSVPTEGDVSRREGMHTEHPPPGEPPILPPPTPLAPQPPLPSQTGADNQVGRRRKNRGRGGRGSAHVLPPPSLPHQEPLPTPHPVEPLPGPTSTARPPNLHSRPAPAPPQGHGSGPAHSPPFCPSRAVSPSQVAAAAIATGMEAVGLRDAPMEDATDSPSHPSHPFHVDDPLPQPMVIGEGQGGLLGQGPHPSSAQPASPTPTLYPASPPTLTYRQAGLRDPRGGEGWHFRFAGDTPPEQLSGCPHPSSPTGPDPDVCGGHPMGWRLPPFSPVAQEVTSSRDEASAPTETPPPGVAEPSLEPHPAEGQEHTTAHTSGSPPRPPSPASTPVPSSPPLIPGDPLGAQAAHGVPSTASSDATAPIDPADTATSPDQVVSCPTCRSSLANRRALQHHIPFCHPADAARRAQAAHDYRLDHPFPLTAPAILVRIAQDPEAAGPTFLLAAAPTLFLVPATPPDRSHTAAIATRISRFGRGEWAELVSDALGRRTPLPRRTGHRSRTATDPSTADERRIARCLRLAACNETSRACAALESAEAAPDTQGTIQRLQSKHPNAERPTPAWQSGFQGSPLVLSVDHLRQRDFHSSAGLFGRTMARVFLASQQFGVGVTCGTEVVVRGVRRALADHPDWVVLQLDVANAFNSFHRDWMFQALQASPEFQCLIPFIGLFYGTPSDLHYRSGTGVVTMHSERGTRQGDPLSPFLYALTQRLALEPVLVEGDVQLWSYADDTYVLGPPDRVLHHFAEIVRRLGEMGLAAQPHKCLVYQTESFLSRDLEAFTGLGIEVARRGLTVTGVPSRHRFVRGAESPGSSREDGAGATLASEVAPAPDSCPPSVGVCQHSSAVPVEDRPSFARSDL